MKDESYSCCNSEFHATHNHQVTNSNLKKIMYFWVSSGHRLVSTDFSFPLCHMTMPGVCYTSKYMFSHSVYSS